jgi:hypothetical protein
MTNYTARNVIICRASSSQNIITMIKSRRRGWTGYMLRMGETGSAFKILIGRREGRISLGRPRHRHNLRIITYKHI